MARDDPVEVSFEVEYPPKSSISCVTTRPSSTKGSKKPPPLIFTHGAGGTLSSPAMQNFRSGFGRVLPVTTFQGPMNLASRTKMFGTVLAHQGVETSNSLGGRSMGARAAVMAAVDGTSHLLLASYPLHTDKQVRDEILVGIPSNVKVIFATGDRDGMCDLSRLNEVRGRMQANTWMIVVKGADHGMETKPKKATAAVGRLVGDVLARWMLKSDAGKTEGEVSWDEKREEATWSGWSPANPPELPAPTPKGKSQPRQRTAKKRKADSVLTAEDHSSIQRKSSRRK